MAVREGVLEICPDGYGFLRAMNYEQGDKDAYITAKKAYDAIPATEKITRDDLKQGTITVSNVGADTRGLSGQVAMLMIIPPQVCVIGIGKLTKKPLVVTDENGEDKVEIRTVLPFT